MLYVVFVDYLTKWPEIFVIPLTSQLGVESSASVNKDKTNDKGGGSRSEWIGHLQSRQNKGVVKDVVPKDSTCNTLFVRMQSTNFFDPY